MRPTHDAIPVLNRLLALEYRSLPMYLMDARPWTHTGDERATQTLRDIVTDQKNSVQRLSDMVLARGGMVRMGEFPMEYTALHDLALDYLIGQVIFFQRTAIARIEHLAEQLGDDRPARDLAMEVLGSERAHLEAIEALPAPESAWMA